jgi:hypothetical protein
MERLKLYLPTLKGESLRLQYFKPFKDLPTSDRYVIEKILGHRIVGGKHQWKVRWQGYDASADTWEPASAFLGLVVPDWVKYNADHDIAVDMRSCVAPE